MFENLFNRHVTTKNIVFFAIAILFLVFMFHAKDIALMFFASFVVACSLDPFVSKLSQKINRNIAVAVTLFGVLGLVCIFVIPIVIIGVHEVKEFAISLPQYINITNDFIKTLPFISNNISIDVSSILTFTPEVTSRVLTGSINFGRNIGSGFIYIIASIMIIYYLIIDKDKIRDNVLKLFPSQMRNRANEIIHTITERIGGYVIAQIITMASVGIIMLIGLLIIRVNYALLMGLLTSLLDIIPVVGPAIALVVCLIISYKLGPMTLALITLMFGIAQLIENNFIRPYVFGKFLALHPIIILLFLFLAGKFIGLAGIIFAPAIAATVVVLIEEIYIKNLG